MFGREEADVFPAYYKANDIGSLDSLLPEGFKVVHLSYNFDPSYTSFGPITFLVTGLLKILEDLLHLHLFESHIVGVIQKQPQ